MKYESCTPTINYGIYVHAIYKKWEGKRQVFEGNVDLDTVCRVKKEYQGKYPGSSRHGVICSIQEDSQGAAEFLIKFQDEKSRVYYTSLVPFKYIDWEDYFRFKTP